MNESRVSQLAKPTYLVPRGIDVLGRGLVAVLVALAAQQSQKASNDTCQPVLNAAVALGKA